MKKLYLVVIITLLIGCSRQPNSGITSSVSKCSEIPMMSLEAKNVKTLSLNTQELKESGIAYLSDSIGFTFDAQAGQSFEYSTNDKICIWIYTPDNQILTGKNLPRDGKYVVQISAPEGQTTFNLSMKLSASKDISKNSPSPQQNKKNIEYVNEQIDKKVVTPTPITQPSVSDVPISIPESAAYQPPIYQDPPTYLPPPEEAPSPSYSDSSEEAPASRPAPPAGRDAN